MMLFASCARGLEPLLVQELEELGISSCREGFCGVFTPRKMSSVYLINYCSRLATRVLWPLAQFRCADKEALYRGAGEIDWQQFLTPSQTFAIDANVSHPTLRHSLFAAQIVKDALCDQLRERFGQRPSVRIAAPDVQLNLFVQGERATISLDTSGEALYKRGYRTETTPAPIQETLAAAILRQVHYGASDVFCDPFCGSGTFLIEAALMKTNTPPGFLRKQWGFSHLPEHVKAQWEQCKQAADAKRVPLEKGWICGADKDRKTIECCRVHLKNAGFEGEIETVAREVSRYVPPHSPTLVVTNPPYGKRLEVSAVYADLAKFLCPESRLYLLTASGTDVAPLKTDQPIGLRNGGLDVALSRVSGVVH